ncbi:hypothetical protein GCM10027435_21740 [Haloparvum alkalitolerans]|uniref:hypothetical protein n=1 Tax=Haloparvum alkalitolerans TaxID=1042953 RepID=UPI003CF39888
MRICTPDVLIGVGGGGTRIVHRLLRRDDVLEQVLTDDGSDGLSAAIIDTETDGDWHREAAARTREGFEAVRSRVDGQPDGLSLHGPVFLPEALGGEVPARLTNKPFVRDLCEAEGLDSWWLDDRTEPLQTLDDAGIGGGTYRFRSLAKALYHAASFSGGSIAPPTTADDDVALVASLGGGTGSGTVLDLAADLEGRRTDLYAVLPHPSESTATLANAHAALSELEHAFLAGESPFDTVTLLPFPADADPAAFEANAVRAFLAHQGALRNGGGSGLSLDLSGGPTAYAPFTVATTRTVQYPISAHEETREAVAEFVDRKRDALQAEAERYDVVESSLRERFPDTAERVLTDTAARGGPIDEAAARSLRSRLVDDLVGTTLEDPVFERLGFDASIEAIRTEAAEVIEDGGRDDGADAVRDFVASAPGTLASIVEHYADHVAEAGGLAEDLFDAIAAEFRTVERRRDLLAAIEAINVEETGFDADDVALVRRSLRRLLDLDRGYPPTDISELEKRSMAAHETVNELDDVLADAESFREAVREDLRGELQSWAHDVSRSVERLTAIGERAEAVRNGIHDLVDAVERAVSEVEAATTVEAVEEIDLRLPEADAVNAGLNEIGVDPIDIASIRDAFDHVKGAKRDALESRGLLSGILGPDWTERYEAHVRQADEWFEISPHPEAFSCSFEASRLRERADAIDDLRAATVGDVVEAFADRFLGREPLAFDRELGDAHVRLPDEEALDGVLDRLDTALDTLARGRSDAGDRPLEGMFGGSPATSSRRGATRRPRSSPPTSTR